MAMAAHPSVSVRPPPSPSVEYSTLNQRSSRIDGIRRAPSQEIRRASSTMGSAALNIASSRKGSGSPNELRRWGERRFPGDGASEGGRGALRPTIASSDGDGDGYGGQQRRRRDKQRRKRGTSSYHRIFIWRRKSKGVDCGDLKKPQPFDFNDFNIIKECEAEILMHKNRTVFFNKTQIDKIKAGVLVGTGMGGLTVFSDGVQALIERGHRKITPFFIPYAITNMGSALLAIDLGLMGPNYSISTACATSNYCFYAAANHIRRGEADVMLAGGTEAAILPIGLGGFVACRALSQRNDEPETASRPWDKNRDGFVMGEGAGVLVMESLEHAMKRDAPIIAEYLGGAVNCDAYHMTDPRADGLGVSSCIQRSLQDAGVSPEEVNYINAHATSTIVGDLAEVNAIKKVFKNTSEIKINATKSMIGHCLGAAGGLEAIATVKAINTGWLHPSINQFNPEPSVEFDTVPNVKQQHEVNVAISNSFGFGGHNSVVAFSAFKP